MRRKTPKISSGNMKLNLQWKRNRLPVKMLEAKEVIVRERFIENYKEEIKGLRCVYQSRKKLVGRMIKG